MSVSVSCVRCDRGQLIYLLIYSTKCRSKIDVTIRSWIASHVNSFEFYRRLIDAVRLCGGPRHGLVNECDSVGFNVGFLIDILFFSRCWSAQRRSFICFYSRSSYYWESKEDVFVFLLGIPRNNVEFSFNFHFIWLLSFFQSFMDTILILIRFLLFTQSATTVVGHHIGSFQQKYKSAAIATIARRFRLSQCTNIAPQVGTQTDAFISH